MHQPAPPRPKLAETVVSPPSNCASHHRRLLRVLGDTAIEYTELGDYSYLGPSCLVADAQIGKFCAIAAQVRIGAPNHPLDRPSQHRFTIVRSTTRLMRNVITPFSGTPGRLRPDRKRCLDGHAVIVMPASRWATRCSGCQRRRHPRCGALHDRGWCSGKTDQRALRSDIPRSSHDYVVELAAETIFQRSAGIPVRRRRGFLRALEAAVVNPT